MRRRKELKKDVGKFQSCIYQHLFWCDLKKKGRKEEGRKELKRITPFAYKAVTLFRIAL